MLGFMEPLLVPVTEACRLLSVSRTVVYELIARGELRPIKVGARTLFAASELERYVSARLAESHT